MLKNISITLCVLEQNESVSIAKIVAEEEYHKIIPKSNVGWAIYLCDGVYRTHLGALFVIMTIKRPNTCC
jgi:hypothetical protein